MMVWYALPAVVALLFKLYLIVSKRHLVNENAAWYYFVFIFAINNFAEYLVLTSGGMVESSFVVRAYHPTAIAVLVYGLIYSIGVSKLLIDRVFIGFSFFFGIILSIGILVSDYIVLGGIQKSYYVTAIKGEFYYLFPLFVLSMCLLISYVLVRNVKNSEDETVRTEALWMMLAIVPSLLITFSCVILMALEFNLNALVFTPIGSTLFLIITLISYNKGINKKDPRKYIPLTRENSFSKAVTSAENAFLTGNLSQFDFESRIAEAALSYSANKIDENDIQEPEIKGLHKPEFYQEAGKEILEAQAQLMLGNASYVETIAIIETAIVDNLIAKYDGNISKASRESGIDRTMIYRKKTKNQS